LHCITTKRQTGKDKKHQIEMNTNLSEPLLSWFVVIPSAYSCSPLLFSSALTSPDRVAPCALSNHISVPFPACRVVSAFNKRFRRIKIIPNANAPLNDDWWMEMQIADSLDRKIEIDKVVRMEKQLYQNRHRLHCPCNCMMRND